MNRIITAVILLAVILTGAVGASEWNKIPLQFVIGTTGASSAANSGIIRISQAAQIDTVYLTDLSGVAKDTTDYATVILVKNGSTIATYLSSATALTANTPLAVSLANTTTAHNLVAGDVLQFQMTKAASGQATTNLTATVTIFNTTSRR